MDLNDIMPFETVDKNGDFPTTVGLLNKELAEVIFDHLKCYGFTPVDIVTGDTYFIFSGCSNSIVHFRVKELWNKFKFGMWINSERLFEEDNDRDTVVSFFCQYETNIDKFKPSRSGLCVEISKKELVNFINGKSYYFQYELRDMLTHIKKHPFIAYSVGEYQHYLTERPIKEFIKYESQEWLKKQREILYNQIYSRYAIYKINQFNSKDCVEDCFVEDIGDGWISSQRITVVVVFKDDTSDEEMDNCVLELLPYKDRFGNLSSFENSLGFEYMRGGYNYAYDYN